MNLFNKDKCPVCNKKVIEQTKNITERGWVINLKYCLHCQKYVTIKTVNQK